MSIPITYCTCNAMVIDLEGSCMEMAGLILNTVSPCVRNWLVEKRISPFMDCDNLEYVGLSNP